MLHCAKLIDAGGLDGVLCYMGEKWLQRPIRKIRRLNVKTFGRYTV
jgi:hypothetical protein